MILEAGYIEYTKVGWASVGILGMHIGRHNRWLFSFEIQWGDGIRLYLDLFWFSFTLREPPEDKS